MCELFSGVDYSFTLWRSCSKLLVIERYTMKKEALTLCLLALLSIGHVTPRPAVELQDQWLQWRARHNKTYPHPHLEARARALWFRHWQIVQSHNRRADVTYSLELNAFADQTKEIMKTSIAPNSYPPQRVPEVSSKRLPRETPPSFDWRKKGVISPVRNQGKLGEADAFAVTEDLESLHAIRTGRLVALSVTEVVDCCSGPFGMLVPEIYECIAQHGGLCSEADYPPHSPPPACHNNSCQAVAKDANTTVRLPRGDETAMMAAVLKRPLVVYVDASHPSFQLYRAGVYSQPQCGHTLDHALQLVGYGLHQGVPYWILKNSWGTAWGLEGYMMMQRGVNMCGVADSALYPQ